MERKRSIALVFLCVACIALPFFFVRFIPSTDLPQHLAQIRLLEFILKNPHQRDFTINVYGANTLVYLLVGINWIIFKPVQAGKAVVIELALAWMFSIFFLAKRRHRSIPTAAIACVFIFNLNFYWGFLNFLIGFPIFALWYIYVVDDQNKRSRATDFAIILLTSFLLFFAHALWFLAGLVFLALGNIIRKRPFRKWLYHCFCLLPVIAWSLIWYSQFVPARGRLDFDTGPYWEVPPWGRLNPYWLMNSVLGGIRGPVEGCICIGIIFWIIKTVKSNRRHFLERADRDFLWISAFFLFIVLLVPEEYMNTIIFAERWAPIAMIFFLLSLPPPQLPESFKFTSAILFLSVLSLATCYSWYEYERKENSGLAKSLDLITEGSNVIGLDFVRNSDYIYVFPFLQTFAYAQVLHGSTLNFSLAEYHSGIVSVAREKEKPTWTQRLEWYPELVKRKDIKQFDYALINGKEEVHRYLAPKLRLRALVTEGRWRLYRCTK
jgi:hypothetical protein